MSKDNNSDFKKLVENLAIFETFLDEVKEDYSKKMNLVKPARIVTPETFSQKDFAVQIFTHIRGKLLRPNSFLRYSKSNSSE